MNSLTKKIYLLLLIFMMVFPTYFINVKYILLGLLLILMIFSILLSENKKINIHKSIFYWTLVLTSTGSIYIMYGLYNGYSDATDLTSIHMIYPWIFLFIITLVDKTEMIEKIFNVILFSTFIIEIYCICYVLSTMNIIPSYVFPTIYIGQNINLIGGISFSVPSLGTLIFTLPLIFTKICIDNRNFSRKKLLTSWIAFILGIIVLLLSGRKVLATIILITPIILCCYTFFLSNKQFKNINIRLLKISAFTLILMSILISLLTFYLGFNISEFNKILIEGFNFNSNNISSDSYIRNLQFNVLLQEWSKNPIFGKGLGATAQDLIRNKDFAWAFELQYMSYLMSFGLVGFLIFASSFLWVINKANLMMKKNARITYYLLPVLIGMISFLIANATNPYLIKFDFMWTIFIPISFVNFYLTTKEETIICEE